MADNPIFPGTEMEVVTKYPDSYRLDHPNFGDVRKTTYAKGVISDFKFDDPDDFTTIQSLVKVKIDDVESDDYIPILYHPKKMYWDDSDEFLATDFNQDNGYHEKAWMSFRCGDEVVVMMKNNEPIAVIGFADGKPRIGENILKIVFDTAAEGENYLLWKFFGKYAPENYPISGLGGIEGILNPWNGEEKGPDDAPLNLTEECPLVASGRKTYNRNGVYWFEDYWPVTEVLPSPPNFYGVEKVIITGSGTIETISEWLVPCGPFMYLFSIKFAYKSENIVLENWDNFGGGWVYNPIGSYVLGFNGPYTIDMKIHRVLFDKDIFESMIGNPVENNKFDEEIWWTELENAQLDNSLDGYFNLEYYESLVAGLGWYMDQKFAGYGGYNNNPLSPYYAQPSDWPDELWNLNRFTPHWGTAKFLVQPHNPSEAS